MKYFILILLSVLVVGCSDPGTGIQKVEPVEFYEYPGNTLVFECQTMVNLSPATVYESKWIIPVGTTLRFVIINSDYMRFQDTPDVTLITDTDIIIEGDGTLKAARLEILTPPTDLHYPSIAVWYNDTYSLIDYEIAK